MLFGINLSYGVPMLVQPRSGCFLYLQFMFRHHQGWVCHSVLLFPHCALWCLDPIDPRMTLVRGINNLHVPFVKSENLYIKLLARSRWPGELIDLILRPYDKYIFSYVHQSNNFCFFSYIFSKFCTFFYSNKFHLYFLPLYISIS